MICRVDLAGLPFPKKAGSIPAIQFLPRPGDVIDVIISIERHQQGVVGKLASNGGPSRQNDGQTWSDQGLDSCCCICWTEARYVERRITLNKAPPRPISPHPKVL